MSAGVSVGGDGEQSLTSAPPMVHVLTPLMLLLTILLYDGTDNLVQRYRPLVVTP